MVEHLEGFLSQVSANRTNQYILLSGGWDFIERRVPAPSSFVTSLFVIRTNQLESAQGGEDPEARALMEQLRQQLGAASQTQTKADTIQPENLGTEGDMSNYLER